MESPAALRRPAFRSVWIAGLVSDAGDWMLLIALPIVVYGLTGSALGTAAAFLAELAPGVVLGPIGGCLADRLDRRRLMMTVTLLQAVTLLALLLVHDRRQLPVLYGVIVVQASLAALFDPAKNALLPTLVPPGELVSANSLVALNGGLARLVGGPLGGLLLAAGSLRAIVAADAVSFLVAAWLIARIPSRFALASRAPTEVPARPAESVSATSAPSDPPTPRAAPTDPPTLRAALRIPGIRPGLAVAFVAEIAQGIFVVLFILFVSRRLHGGSSEIGLLRGVQAIGAIGGALALTILARARPPGVLVAGGLLAFGAVDLTIWNLPALTTATVVYAGLFVLAGAPGVVVETGLISLFGVAAPEGIRGRIFGALGVVSNAGQAIGMVAAGTLAASLGLMALLNVQGLLYLGAGALALRGLARAGAAWGLPTSVDAGARLDPPPGGGRGPGLAGDSPAAGARRLAAASDPGA